MAEPLVSASTGAMVSVLKKLGTMLSDEYKLLKGVRDDIRFLKDELKAMQAFLLMMADVEKPDPQAKLRADAVREMSYEIEDTIDRFMFEVEHVPKSKSDGIGKIFKKGTKKIKGIMTRHKIAKDIKEIKSQVTEISQRNDRYKVDESSISRNKMVDPRIVAVYKDVTDLVGIDGPRDELVSWLGNKEGESNQPKILSIVGSGGLGKTTLARQVYDKLGATYDCQAFVSISRSPDMKKILSSILSQLRREDYAHREDELLTIEHIRNFLKDKRYFIIIDDIWDTSTWDTLVGALVKNDCGSVIMITTRKHDVARYCCSSPGHLIDKNQKIHEIKPLSYANSKELFFKRIFGCKEGCPSNFKEASENILKKCGGLPLAINAISSLLATGKTKEEWYRLGCSIGFAHGEISDIDVMNYILSLSYFDLPLHLRSCLLYVTMFPEDYLIQRQRLVHRWISEGLIHSKSDGKDLVELGEAYYHELINRSLLQPVDIRYDGKASSCQVHDTILDFLIYKSTEENFCTLLSKHPNRESRIRRLSLMRNDDNEKVKELDLSRVRSLSCFGDAYELPSIPDPNSLRVLDIEDCGGLGNHLPKYFGRLFQLRYLNICYTRITELPEEIGDLEYLETLDALHAYNLAEMPKSVTRLRRLARLFVMYTTKLPHGIGNMENLQELWYINPLKQSLNFIEELVKLTNLRKLKIVWDTSESDEASTMKEEKLAASLCKLDESSLRSLHIKFQLKEKDATFIDRPLLPALNSIREIELNGGHLRWIVHWLVTLDNLEKLDVQTGHLEQDDIEKVASIPSLVEFNVIGANSGSSTITITEGFQQLHTLWLSLRAWRFVFEAGAMPNLKKLHLFVILREYISGGGSFDLGIQHLSSLALLSIDLVCIDAKDADVEAAESEFKCTADTHPNRPTLEMTKHLQSSCQGTMNARVPWENQEG